MRISQLIDAPAEWIVPAPIDPTCGWNALDSHPLVSAILHRRGITSREEAEAFLDPSNGPRPDPMHLPNMAAAVDRIRRAISQGETIAIFGDYDVDGITSSLILTEALTHATGPRKVITRLPERAEGYGLNPRAIAEFQASGVSLVIAVDCGSTDHDHAAALAQAGIGLVIFDHHHMLDSGPAEAITVSPQLNGDGTYHDLTAAGVAWLAVSALADAGVPVTEHEDGVDGWLELAALGTVADVAPVVGVNRWIVARGVTTIRTRPRPGVEAVVRSSGLEPASVSATDISFALAPRLNAAGRIDTPRLAFDLLATRDRTEARQLALLLEQVNIKRKSRSAQLLDQARAQITKRPGWQQEPVFTLQHADWEPGLVGAVASRLVEDVRRPVLLFQSDGNTLHGSARSVDGINIVELLAEVAPSLTRYGGHSLAAGVTLQAAELESVTAHLVQSILATGIQVPMPRQIRIDAKVPGKYLVADTVRQLDRLEPFGRGNERPTMLIERAQLLQYAAMGSDRSHLKIQARHEGRQIEAIAWGSAWRSKELIGARSISLAGKLEINSWNGQERLQMVLDDFRIA
jgi:single-stranded-DNA-specific exonuclease